MKRHALRPLMLALSLSTIAVAQCPPGNTTLCIPLDASFSVAQMGGTAPCYRNDDSSTAAIPLQFSFNLFGTQHTSLFINNNGNVSFGGSFGTYTSTGFPAASYTMVAPFWADVDTRNVGGGVVWYRSEPTRFTVIWDHVGYFSNQINLLNTFQLIITDGSDPLIGIGNNACFCYDDMQWTTGSASQGVGGFGGVPATVGINAGDGVNFFQVGRFDHAGVDYDGPGGSNDGVSYLDNQTLCFNVAVAVGNTAPVALNLPPSNQYECMVGQPTTIAIDWIPPELNETVANISVNTFGLQNLVVNPPVLGSLATQSMVFTPTMAQLSPAPHFVDVTATDSHPTTPLSTTVRLRLRVCITGTSTQIGLGCPGSGAAPTLTSTIPTLGSQMTLDISSPGTPSSLAILTFGTSQTFDPIWGNLPLSLTPHGAPGCTAFCSVLLAIVIQLDGVGSSQFLLQIPNSPTFCGYPLCNQSLILDGPANALGVITSSATYGRVGR